MMPACGVWTQTEHLPDLWERHPLYSRSTHVALPGRQLAEGLLEGGKKCTRGRCGERVVADLVSGRT